MDSWGNIQKFQNKRVVEIIEEYVNESDDFIIEKIRITLGITYEYAVDLYNKNS